MSMGDVACSYAALILHDEGIPITADKISTLVKAANIQIESYWAPLFARLFQNRSVDDLIAGIGSGGGGAAAAAAPTAAAAPAAAPAVEEKKEEPKEESDDDMGFSLFD